MFTPAVLLLLLLQSDSDPLETYRKKLSSTTHYAIEALIDECDSETFDPNKLSWKTKVNLVRNKNCWYVFMDRNAQDESFHFSIELSLTTDQLLKRFRRYKNDATFERDDLSGQIERDGSADATLSEALFDLRYAIGFWSHVDGLLAPDAVFTKNEALNKLEYTTTPHNSNSYQVVFEKGNPLPVGMRSFYSLPKPKQDTSYENSIFNLVWDGEASMPLSYEVLNRYKSPNEQADRAVRVKIVNVSSISLPENRFAPQFAKLVENSFVDCPEAPFECIYRNGRIVASNPGNSSVEFVQGSRSYWIPVFTAIILITVLVLVRKRRSS